MDPRTAFLVRHDARLAQAKAILLGCLNDTTLPWQVRGYVSDVARRRLRARKSTSITEFARRNPGELAKFNERLRWLVHGKY